MRLLRTKGFLRGFFRRDRTRKPPLRYPADIEERIDKWVREMNYRKPCRTNLETARDFGMDPGVLASYFKYVRGEDIRSWRTRLRIDDAKELLKTRKNLSVSSIAWTVGFSDNSNFSRQFRKYTGLTPSEWRSVNT